MEEDDLRTGVGRDGAPVRARMALTLKIDTRTEHGTDKGGEDLFVDVVATTGTEEPAGLPEAFEAAWRAWTEGLPTSRDDADDADAPLFLKDGRVQGTFETDYGFRVDSSYDDFRSRVLRVVLEGEWKKVLRTGEYSVEGEIFVAGNAD